MQRSIEIMVDRIASILNKNDPTIFLYGSVVLDDFKVGWSDIDFICLTKKSLESGQADELLFLRQTLTEEHADNPYFRLFEGGILSLEAFIHDKEDTAVYWGSSGQRRTNRYALDCFGKMVLIEKGRLILGSDFRDRLLCPTREEIVSSIQQHYKTIRMHGKSGVGWLLDIARCLYTLRTNEVIAKTKAGEWALGENICPDVQVMERAIAVRSAPQKWFSHEETQRWMHTLTPFIQRFADVLEQELAKELLHN